VTTQQMYQGSGAGNFSLTVVSKILTNSLLLMILWFSGAVLAADKGINKNLLPPQWTHGAITSEDGTYLLDWSDIDNDQVDYFLLVETSSSGKREFKIARDNFLSEGSQAHFVQGRTGRFNYTIRACHKNEEEDSYCSKKSSRVRVEVSAPYVLPSHLTLQQPAATQSAQAQSTSSAPGGPDQLSPGTWWNPARDGHGWSFYWVSNLRFPPNHAAYGNTFDLIGFWYTYRNFGSASSPNWQPALFVTLFSDEGGGNFTGQIIYQEYFHQTGTRIPHYVGTATVHLGADNRNTQVSWSATGIHPCAQSDLDNSGTCSFSESLGYLGDASELNLGSGTSPIDHYEGWWVHYDVGANNARAIDYRFAFVQWMENELEYSLVSLYDDNGQPTWVSAIQTGFAPGNGYTTTSPTEFCYNYVQNGYSAAQNEPAGRGGNSSYPVGCATREFLPQNQCLDGRNQYFNSGNLILDLTLPPYRSGHLQVQDGPGSPTDLERFANFQSVSYSYDGQLPTVDTCNLGVSGQCNLKLTWFTDGDYPGARLYRKKIGTSGLTYVSNMSEPSVVDYPHTLSQTGTYYFELHRGYSSSPVIAKSCDFVVVNEPVSTQETVTYYHVDALGSVVAATDQNGNILFQEHYDPYGARIQDQSAEDNSLWYTGKEFDADTGLAYMGSRWYDPRLGRNYGIDPVGTIPQAINGFNRYAYVDNNPYRYIDPDGEFAFVPAIIWGVATALTAYDTYTTYQEQGAEAAAKTLAIDGAILIATGGTVKILSSGVKLAGKSSRIVNAAEEVYGKAKTFVSDATKSVRTKKVAPIKDADGAHTTWKTDPQTGQITRHETWTPNPRNPSGFDKVQSTDLKGAPHINKKTGEAVPTPHTQGKNIPGGVRPARPNEIPRQ